MLVDDKTKVHQEKFNMVKRMIENEEWSELYQADELRQEIAAVRRAANRACVTRRSRVRLAFSKLVLLITTCHHSNPFRRGVHFQDFWRPLS